MICCKRVSRPSGASNLLESFPRGSRSGLFSFAPLRLPEGSLLGQSENVVFTAAAAILLAAVISAFAAGPPRFQKVSDHFYYLQSSGDAANVGAVVTDDGVLLIDTQLETDVPGILEALKRITPKPVRWVVNTNFHEHHTGGNSYFSRQNVSVIASQELRRLLAAQPKAASANTSASSRQGEALKQNKDAPAGASPGPQFIFRHQLRLFPGGVEVRFFAVKHKAQTAGDLVVFLPAEKVLQVGDLYVGASYPGIDAGVGEGSALGWLDGMHQVIEAVPLTKSAMPQPRTDPTKAPPVEKSLEEMVVVIPGHGPASNLQEMKNLLETSQKLRNEVSRAIAAGRSLESLMTSPTLAPFRSYRNLESYVTQLHEALTRK